MGGEALGATWPKSNSPLRYSEDHSSALRNTTTHTSPPENLKGEFGFGQVAPRASPPQTLAPQLRNREISANLGNFGSSGAGLPDFGKTTF